MKIKVRLYGALGKGIAGHDPLKGLTLDLPDGSQVIDLIEYLKIPRKKVGIISIDGSLAKDSRVLQAGNFVVLYRPIFGG